MQTATSSNSNYHNTFHLITEKIVRALSSPPPIKNQQHENQLATARKLSYGGQAPTTYRPHPLAHWCSTSHTNNPQTCLHYTSYKLQLVCRKLQPAPPPSCTQAKGGKDLIKNHPSAPAVAPFTAESSSHELLGALLVSQLLLASLSTAAAIAAAIISCTCCTFQLVC